MCCYRVVSETIISASALFKGITAAVFSLAQMLEAFIALVAQEGAHTHTQKKNPIPNLILKNT